MEALSPKAKDWSARVDQASADLSAWYRGSVWKDAVSVFFGGEDEATYAYKAAVALLNMARAKIIASGIEFPESKLDGIVAPLVAHAYDTIHEDRPFWLLDFLKATASDLKDAGQGVVDAARNPLIGGGLGLVVGFLFVLWLAK